MLTTSRPVVRLNLKGEPNMVRVRKSYRPMRHEMTLEAEDCGVAVAAMPTIFFITVSPSGTAKVRN